MKHIDEYNAIQATLGDYTISQAVEQALEALFDLVNQTDTKRTLHFYAKFECLTLLANKRFNALSEHEKQSWKAKKVGIYKRPVFELLNDARDTLSDRLNVENPIEPAFVRSVFSEIGIPSKPYEVLAIQEELRSMQQPLKGDDTKRRQRGLDFWNSSPSVTWADVAIKLDGTEETKNAVKAEINRYAEVNELHIEKKRTGRKRMN